VTRIALVRHGQTDWNRTRRIQGASDIPLNDVGRRQARDAAATLAGGGWTAVYSSPLSRAAETASLIAAGLGLPEPVAVPGIAERGYGGAEGLTGDEVRERFGSSPVPGREPVQSVLARALGALDDLAERHPDDAIVVVSHGGVIGALVRWLTDEQLPVPGTLILNGSAHLFEHRDGSLALVDFAAADEDLDMIDDPDALDAVPA
jgi:probable phosphoglycerate mutase